MKYDRGLDNETSWRVTRIRMWEEGHTFEEIDNLTLGQIGDILGYWSERERASKKPHEDSE